MKSRVLITVALLALAVPATATAQPSQPKTACFGAESWGANDADRPCTTIYAPSNGQVRVVQGTATQAESVCVLPYATPDPARCHRIAAGHAAPNVATGAHAQATCTDLHLCASITVPQEDGSGALIVRVGGHSIRCTLSNPTEERGRFSVPCSA